VAGDVTRDDGPAGHDGGSDAGTQSEIERLRAELADAREQLAATSKILPAIARSTSDLEGALETILQSARQLCRADAGQIYLLEGDRFRLAYESGLNSASRELFANRPILLDRSTLVGRVGLDRRATQIADVLADVEYGPHDAQRLAGYRTIMGVPMLVDDEVFGVLSVWRTQVNPFSERSVEVLTAFAAQAAVAIRTMDLVTVLRARTDELGRRVHQLEALGEVSEAVSSSLDLTEVLTTIVEHAVRLSGADGGSIFEFDDEAMEFRIRTVCGTSPEVLEALRRARMGLDDTFIGEAAKDGRPRQLPDLREVPSDPHLRVLDAGGWRSMMAVPMLREGHIVGTLVLRRRSPGRFPEEISDLVEAFASQSALALLNARLYRRLERQSTELEVASRHKSEFLASMSHELRTPLNAVIGFSEVLLDRMFGDLNERQDEYLRDIWSSGKHLLELLNDILDLSKVEAGQMVLERSTFPVREALENCLSLVRERALRQRIALSLDVEPGIAPVDADRLRFKQVVLNLLSNAVKFTPEGGRVDVRAAVRENDIVVTVADTGIGVPAEDRERIFESFQQGTRVHHEAEGTGLGLTLSKKIVELHGGTIWVESEAGEGSLFGFTLPLGAASSAAPAAAPVVERARPVTNAAEVNGPTVVVIEDDRKSFDLLRVYLEGVGVRVVGARDGDEGLDTVRRLHPAGVVLDILLPGTDGWDVLAQLKADPMTASIPVIVVSMLDERGRGSALGASEYLVKPVSKEQLLAALYRAVAVPGERLVVVVIDDDPLALELARAALEPEGWTVYGATTGADGIALIRERDPSVVLLDLLMPGMDGFEVVGVLRTDSATVGIPVVVLTSVSISAPDKERLRGRISYLAQKAEFDVADLARVLRRAAAGHDGPVAETR
jgi:signal transduction histidine kinase/DNA-binding response OmpR family regulator